jgi:hypothetical protein
MSRPFPDPACLDLEAPGGSQVQAWFTIPYAMTGLDGNPFGGVMEVLYFASAKLYTNTYTIRVI